MAGFIKKQRQTHASRRNRDSYSFGRLRKKKKKKLTRSHRTWGTGKRWVTPRWRSTTVTVCTGTSYHSERSSISILARFCTVSCTWFPAAAIPRIFCSWTCILATFLCSEAATGTMVIIRDGTRKLKAVSAVVVAIATKTNTHTQIERALQNSKSLSLSLSLSHSTSKP